MSHVPVLAQVADVAAQLHLRHEVDVAAVDGRRAHRQVVAVADVLEDVLDLGGRAVRVEQGRNLFDELAAFAAQFERLGVVVRNEHQRHVGVTRNVFAEFQQVTVDFGLLLGRIVGFLHAEVHETGEVVEDVAGQEDFRPLSQRFVKVEKLERFVAQKCFRFAYNFHFCGVVFVFRTRPRVPVRCIVCFNRLVFRDLSGCMEGPFLSLQR